MSTALSVHKSDRYVKSKSIRKAYEEAMTYIRICSKFKEMQLIVTQNFTAQYIPSYKMCRDKDMILNLHLS